MQHVSELPVKDVRYNNVNYDPKRGRQKQMDASTDHGLLVAFCADFLCLIWTGVAAGGKNIVDKKLSWRLCAMTGTARDCNMAAPQCLHWHRAWWPSAGPQRRGSSLACSGATGE